MELDFSALSSNQVYHTLIQSIVPRPIAWVLSENSDASYNLAPFSYFTAVSSNPPLLMFSVGKRPDNNEKKDTLRNIIERPNFVVHIASTVLANQVAKSSAPLVYGDSEVDHADLELTPFSNSPLPRISVAKIALACELFEIKEIGNQPMALVFGEIKSAFINDEIAESDGSRTTINSSKLDPLVRLGGDDYAGITPNFQITRPK